MHARMIFLGLAVLFPGLALGKELLDARVINASLTESNPYVYTAIAHRYVSQARAEATEGTFDTRLGVKYDNKQYPVSDGEFTDVFVEKPTESGVEFLVGYRKAEGVQEYNNIKTGDEGEMRLGVKVPVFALVEGMNERTYRHRTATLDARQAGFSAQDNLRQLRFDVFTAYYSLLYWNEAVALVSELLERARQRQTYVQQKVSAGELPEIESLEARRQVLNREQRLVETETAYRVALGSFLRYLGLTREAFETRYTLPSLSEHAHSGIDLSGVLEHALENRPDIRLLRSESDRFALRDDYIAVEKYPRFNVALYGVHDFEYDNGFKISVDMDFPIERRGYHGRKREVQTGRRAVEEALLRKRMEIETSLSNQVTSLYALQTNLKKAGEEIEVARALEAAERKKFRLGAGDLMLVNQRELNTLEAELNRRSYALRLQQAVLKIQREAGTMIGGDRLQQESGAE